MSVGKLTLSMTPEHTGTGYINLKGKHAPEQVIWYTHHQKATELLTTFW